MVCRVCLLESANLIDIFGLKGKELNVADIIGQHFSFQPKEDDVSKRICSNCWQNVDNFHSFYVRVEEVQKGFLSKTSPRHEFFSTGKIQLETEDYSFQGAEDTSRDYLKAITPITLIKTDDVTQKNASFVHEKNGARSLPLDQDSETTYLSDNSSISSTLKAKIDDEGSDYEPPKRLEKKRKSPSGLVKKLDEIDGKIASFMKLKCNQCDYEGETFANVLNHCKRIHQVAGFVSCCNKKFRKRVYLLDHIEQHTNPNSLKCEECNRIFINRSSFRKHLKDHSTTIVKPFKCNECSKEFRHRTNFTRHKLIHVPLEERKIVCEECKKPFASVFLLQKHQKYVHENIYGKMCDICAKVIKGITEFERHQMTHKGIEQPKLTCHICGALFRSKKGHKFHVLAHTDTNIYTCKTCNGKFKSQRNLNAHIRRNHNPKSLRFKCNVCDKLFKSKEKLTEHCTTHTGEKLYTCPYCPKSFAWNANFHEHKKKAHPVELAEWRKNRVNNLKCNTVGLNQ